MASPSAAQVAALVVPVAGAMGVLAWRLRETQRPVSERSLILPPLMMSTGLGMFLMPSFQVPWLWAAIAFAAGAVLLAYPMLRATRLEREHATVRLRHSRAFLTILIVLAAVRIALRDQLDDIVSPRQTASLFFLLAFGMIVRWCVTLFLQYRALHRR